MSDTTAQTAVPTSVYRYYDAAGILLYVGVTSRGTARNREHWSSKHWWQFVAHQEVDHLATRAEALRRERHLITSYRPPFNKQHNPDHERLQAIYQAFADGYQPTTESFLEMYKRLNRKVALRPLLDRGAPPNHVWFATLPEHFELARTMTLPTGQESVREPDGRYSGRVLHVVHERGLAVLLRVQIRAAIWPPASANAVLKIVDLKRQQTRITFIEVVL